MTTSHKRTGASLLVTPMTCPKATAMTLGFSEEQAERIIRIRRVLPTLEARTVPGLDARKLWERIGKPHGRFNMWADRAIKPMTSGGFSAQICAVVEQTARKGTPRVDYLLSRDVAAHLAMQANTEEGKAVRAYFLDMEELALVLARHMPVRAARLIELDNELDHLCIKGAAELGKAEGWSTATRAHHASEAAQAVKREVCKVLTGHTSAEWRATFQGRGVRDMLDPGDLETYARAMDFVLSLVRTGSMEREEVTKLLEAAFTGRIKAEKYAGEWQAAPPAVDFEGSWAPTAGMPEEDLSDEF